MKTKEELKEIKQEYETLTNKLKELSENELSIVVGGNVDSNTNLQFVSPELQIVTSEGICKPLCTWVSKEINGKPYTKKALVCSDFSLRGTKPECANCPAKNGVN